MVISFLGVWADRQGFGIFTWKHVGTQKISTQSSKLEVRCQSYMPPRRTGMHNDNRAGAMGGQPGWKGKEFIFSHH